MKQTAKQRYYVEQQNLYWHRQNYFVAVESSPAGLYCIGTDKDEAKLRTKAAAWIPQVPGSTILLWFPASHGLRAAEVLREVPTDFVNPRAVKVGDIFEMSWGYDQTNVDYFQVVSVTGKGVYVREIGAKTVPGSEGFMSDRRMPAPDAFLQSSSWCEPRGIDPETGCRIRGNVPTFRRIDYSGDGGASFNFRGRYFARRISATESTYCSWYA